MKTNEEILNSLTQFRIGLISSDKVFYIKSDVEKLIEHVKQETLDAVKNKLKEKTVDVIIYGGLCKGLVRMSDIRALKVDDL